MAHLSFPQDESERSVWLSRYAVFGISSGMQPAQAEGARTAISNRVPVLSAEQDEAVLRDAGFSDVSLLYVGLAFRGWVAYLPT
jgi:tRNA (cmo5U34)-methyltransferase